MKIRQILNENEDPEVLVRGVGVYKLKQLEENVKRKLNDLNMHASKAVNVTDWKRIQWMINHAAMHEMINTIVEAHEKHDTEGLE